MKTTRRRPSILISILLLVFLLGFFIYLLSPLDTEQEMSLHPYIGYVMNPQYQDGINSLGFRGELPDKNSAHYSVGIFGGSVAHMYAVVESENLQQQLAQNLNKDTKDIAIYSFAVPGHKQPQQLMTLTYLYSLGYLFDLVINIDGFNEAALSYVESHKQGVTSYYPRNWHVLSRTNMGFRSRILAGILIGIRNTQNSMARFSWGRSQSVKNIMANLHYRVTLLVQQSLLAEKMQYQTGGPELAHEQNNLVPIEDKIVEMWTQSARQMDRISKANGAHYIEILHPNQYIQNSKPFSKEELMYFVKSGHPYAKPASYIYPKIIKEAQKLHDEGINIVDSTKLFINHPETLYLDDCCHYNKKGYGLLHQEIVRHISIN